MGRKWRKSQRPHRKGSRKKTEESRWSDTDFLLDLRISLLPHRGQGCGVLLDKESFISLVRAPNLIEMKEYRGARNDSHEFRKRGSEESIPQRLNTDASRNDARGSGRPAGASSGRLRKRSASSGSSRRFQFRMKVAILHAFQQSFGLLRTSDKVAVECFGESVERAHRTVR